jgi:hypothetical protein
MDLTLEDLHQPRLLETETDDPLAERLVRDLIVEIEDRLTPGRTSFGMHDPPIQRQNFGHGTGCATEVPQVGGP